MSSLSNIFGSFKSADLDKLSLVMVRSPDAAARNLQQQTLDLLASVARRKDALGTLFRVFVTEGATIGEQERKAERLTAGQKQSVCLRLESPLSPPGCSIQINDAESGGWLLSVNTIQSPPAAEALVECILAAGLTCRGQFREAIVRLETLLAGLSPQNPEWPSLKIFAGNASLRDYWHMSQYLETVPAAWSSLPFAIKSLEEGVAALEAFPDTAGHAARRRWSLLLAVAWNNLGWALAQGPATEQALERSREYLLKASECSLNRGAAEESSVVKANLRRVETRLSAIQAEMMPIKLDVERAREMMRETLGMPSGRFRFPGLGIAWRLVQAITLAGDFFNFLYRKDGSLGILLVDVEGHGIGAAQQAQAIHQSLFRPSVEWGMGDPVAELGAADRRIEEELGSRRLAAPMMFTVIYPDQGIIAHAGAGMPAPLLFRRDGGRPVSLAVKGAYVGAGYSELIAEPREAMESFGPGDVLVAFSDGIVEARNASGATFGVTRLTDAVAEGIAGAVAAGVAMGSNAEQIADEVMRAVREHTGKNEPDDDQTLIVVVRES